MTRNSKDAKSLLDLQKTLTDLASWKLAVAQSKKTALESCQKDLLEALTRHDGASSALIPLISKKLLNVNRDISVASRQLEEQSREAIAHCARSKMAERIFQRLELGERSKAERKALMELIERQLAPRKSSPA